MTDRIITYDILLDMLGIVLIEIRARKNQQYAKALADVFHNVPARIIIKMEPNNIYLDMLKVAKRHGGEIENYIEKLSVNSYAKMHSARHKKLRQRKELTSSLKNEVKISEE